MRTAWATVQGDEERRTVAWDLLRSLLPPGARLSNACPSCGGPHGPVRVDGVAAPVGVSYARSRTTGATVAVAALAGGPACARAFAIDAEFADDPVRDTAGAPLSLSISDWVRVEAALKADGRGVRVDPASIELRGTPDSWTARIPGFSGVYRGRDLPVPGLIVAAAWR